MFFHWFNVYLPTKVLVFSSMISFFISINGSIPGRVAILATTMLTLMNLAGNTRAVSGRIKMINALCNDFLFRNNPCPSILRLSTGG